MQACACSWRFSSCCYFWRTAPRQRQLQYHSLVSNARLFSPFPVRGISAFLLGGPVTECIPSVGVSVRLSHRLRLPGAVVTISLHHFALSVLLSRSYGKCLLIAWLSDIFSERELTFTFAICYRPSVCRMSVCRLSSVCRL